MFSLSKTRSSYRRTIWVYLVAIVAPTLVFLYLGLQSVGRQRQAITSLTGSNLRLSAERLAVEMERRVSEYAEACLADEELTQIPSMLDNSTTPEAARELRMSLEIIRGRYPIASHHFILQGGAVLFPLLRTPSPKPIDDEIARQEQEAGERFAALFSQGESQELLQNDPGEALTLYRQAYELPVSDWLKALAVARVARCSRKFNQGEMSEEAYRLLVDRYGDVYDTFHRPYALTAALELDDLRRSQGQTSSTFLVGVFRDLVEGRWELSADQIDYFVEAVGERLGESKPVTGKTQYLTQIEQAHALKNSFRHYGPLQAGEVYGYAFSQGGNYYQTFYTPVSVESGQETLIGIDVDLNWVENDLLPQCRKDLELYEGFAVALGRTQEMTSDGGQLAAHVSFKTIFPFWQLSVGPSSPEGFKANTRRQIFVFGGSTLLVLTVLILGVLLLMRDVSRESRISRLRSDFISAVSHELKTPITLIRLYGETLLHGKQFREKERRDYYQIITRESERLSVLIDKVLDFSRIDRGQKEYHLEEGDPTSVISGTVEVFRQYLMRQGYSVKTNLATSLPAIRFDRDAVSEAILNLMDNASKYAGESKYVSVRLLSTDNQVIFEVEDRGIGIPAEEQEKIFHRFYRAQSKTGKGGYGLGLFLVRHIMDAHGGKVEVHSEPGRGSRFRLIFPVQYQSAMAKENGIQ